MRLDLTNDDTPVRMCMRVDQATEVVEGSVQKNCDECDVPIWVDENQVVIHPETGERITKEWRMCMACLMAHMLQQEESPVWLTSEKRDDE